DTIADSFYAAGIEASAITGYSSGMSHADFVNKVYQNVLGRRKVPMPRGLRSGVQAWPMAAQAVVRWLKVFCSRPTPTKGMPSGAGWLTCWITRPMLQMFFLYKWGWVIPHGRSPSPRGWKLPRLLPQPIQRQH